jgi:transcriptional/translational regulatory protein YebC/TACO1
VAWQFEPRGAITVALGKHSQDDVFEAALDAGAEDVEFSDGVAEVYTDPGDLKAVQDAFRLRGLPVEGAELTRKAKVLLSLDDKTTISVLNLIENLEDLDDVTNVYANLEISEEVLQSMEE